MTAQKKDIEIGTLEAEADQLRADLAQANATNEALAKSLFEHQVALEEANEMITGLRHRIIDLKVTVARTQPAQAQETPGA